jgi:hypothetical protein
MRATYRAPPPGRARVAARTCGSTVARSEIVEDPVGFAGPRAPGARPRDLMAEAIADDPCGDEHRLF